MTEVLLTSISDRVPSITEINVYFQLFLLFVIKYSLIPIDILTDTFNGSDRMILFEQTATFFRLRQEMYVRMYRAE